MGSFYLTTAMIIYLVSFMPFADNFYNRTEVMNEITNLLMLYVMLMFSDLVPDPEMRYSFGWIAIGLFCANHSVHLFFLLGGLFKRVPLKIFKKCKLKKNQAVKEPSSRPEPTQSLAVVEECKNEEASLENNDIEAQHAETKGQVNELGINSNELLAGLYEHKNKLRT